MTETAPAPPWAAGLDPAQLAAVTHHAATLLVVAGAGSGKTRTLVCRVAHLLAQGCAPERLLVVTFSRRAAEELGRRLAGLVGADAAGRVTAGTFHAVAHRLLRQHGGALGLPERFSVLDPGDSADLMQLARQATAPGGGERRRFPRPALLVAIYSWVVTTRQPLAEALRTRWPWCREHEAGIAAAFDAYVTRKQAQALLDFDDLLLHWRAAATDPAVGPALADRWDHILVDEYQDTNVVQGDIVRALRAGGRPLTMVGDDAQAIYGFRAATVRNMLDAPAQFPGCAVVTLERNHRSTQPILDVANAVLAGLGEGFAKRLWTDRPGGARPVLALCPDEAAEAEAVAETVLDHHDAGIPLREQAVLFRSAHHSDLLEVELRRRGIPFVKHGGLKFLDAAHVRDLVAALRVLDNPRDELAWYRLLQRLDGVGPAGARRALAELGVVAGPGPAAGPARGCGPAPAGAAGPWVDPLARFVDPGRPLPPRAAADAERLAAALSDCRRGGLVPAAQVERLRDGLAHLLERRYPDADVRLRDLDALAQLAARYPSREAFTAELTLDPPASTSDLAGAAGSDDDELVLSTVHSAKGGEWTVVHLIHATDGCFPSDLSTGDAASVDEERRLFYVALTRARGHLHVYAPLRYHYGGPRGQRDAHTYAQRSRFLTPGMEPLFATRPVRRRAADAPVPVPAVPVAAAVADALRGLW